MEIKPLKWLPSTEKVNKAGIATPKPEIDLIKSRLKYAEQFYPKWLEEIKHGK
jgi:hypothetical protein